MPLGVVAWRTCAVNHDQGAVRPGEQWTLGGENRMVTVMNQHLIAIDATHCPTCERPADQLQPVYSDDWPGLSKSYTLQGLACHICYPGHEPFPPVYPGP